MESKDGTACNFSFAYDNPKFSDRILAIEIISDAVNTESNGTADSAARNRKRSRSGSLIIRRENGEGSSNSTIPVMEESTASVKQGKGGDEMIDESSLGSLLEFNKSGDETASRHDATGSRDSSSVLPVKFIHVSSAILARDSPYFYKLFSNGMKESSQRLAILRIHASGAAMMELLNFLYNNTLSTTMPSGLLDILTIADKFEVASCIRYCIQRLRSLPMTIESALSYMNLPSSVLQAEGVQQLTDSAKQYIACQFRNLENLEDEVLNLPLVGLEAVLSRDDIQVDSEDAVYDILLKWAGHNYPSLRERKEVLETRLYHLIRFPYMSSQKLKGIMAGTNFSFGVASTKILEALFFKTDPAHIQRKYVAGEHAPERYTDHRYVERAYRRKPVKEIELELPHHHSIAYLELKREECMRLSQNWSMYSQNFYLGSRTFFLLARCSMEQQNTPKCFGLYLGLRGSESRSIAVDFNFAVFLKEENDYKEAFKGSNYTFAGGNSLIGVENLFEVPWTSFIAYHSPYFHNNKLHLRVKVAVKQ